MRRRGGWVVIVLPVLILVLLAALLFGSARRDDVGQLADRAEARALLATHLRSAATEAWWVLASAPPPGFPTPGFQALWSQEPPPDASTFAEPLTTPRAAAAAASVKGLTLSGAAFAVRAWLPREQLPQGVGELTVKGSYSWRRVKVSLTLHQLRRFWVFAAVEGTGKTYAGLPSFSRELSGSWVESK